MSRPSLPSDTADRDGFWGIMAEMKYLLSNPVQAMLGPRSLVVSIFLISCSSTLLPTMVRGPRCG
jgi:hypothetical protein